MVLAGPAWWCGACLGSGRTVSRRQPNSANRVVNKGNVVTGKKILKQKTWRNKFKVQVVCRFFRIKVLI